MLGRLAVLSVLILAGVLGGCIVSKKPLVTQPVFPIKAGTEFVSYEIGPTGEVEPQGIRRIGIERGYYHLYAPEFAKTDKHELNFFKLAPLPAKAASASTFWIAMHGDRYSKTLAYSVLERRDDLYVDYQIAARDFLHYIEATGRQDSHHWTMTGEESDPLVEVGSLAFLEQILPEMIERGFYSLGTAYRVITPGLADKPLPHPSADEPTPEQMIAAFSQTLGCDIVAGCAPASGSLHLRLVSFEKIRCQARGEGSAVCAYQAKLDCSLVKPDPQPLKGSLIVPMTAWLMCASTAPTTRTFLRTGATWTVLH